MEKRSERRLPSFRGAHFPSPPSALLENSPTLPPASHAALSRREREVLILLAEGNTNQQAADRLFLSVKTIETYRVRITEKLGLRSRADIIRYAMETSFLGSSHSDLSDAPP